MRKEFRAEALTPGGADRASPAPRRQRIRPATEPPAPPESPAPAPGPPTTTVLLQDEIQGLLGKPVRDGAGEDMGHIVNVIVDRTGQARRRGHRFRRLFSASASRKIAVDWNAPACRPGRQSATSSPSISPRTR